MTPRYEPSRPSMGLRPADTVQPRSHADPGEMGVQGCAVLVVPLVVLALLVGLVLVGVAVASVALEGMT